MLSVGLFGLCPISAWLRHECDALKTFIDIHIFIDMNNKIIIFFFDKIRATKKMNK